MSQTVLLIDDEDSILEILATWLEDAGYSTCTASNGFDGLVALNDFKPDLVVTDILMPRMDGFELCRMMREFSPAPVMFLSGLQGENDKRTGFRMGGSDYLSKPVSMNIFLTHISRLINQSLSNEIPIIDVIR